MRVGVFIVSATLAGAGVAFAQSDWVVDPWSPALSPTPASKRAPETTSPSPSQKRVEWIDERSVELADPWLSATMARGTATVQVRSSARVNESGEWAKPVPLLVDPWDKKPAQSSVPAPDLIVDPWAHEGKL